MTLWSLNAYSLFMLNFVHNMCKTRLYNILDSLKKHFVGFCILTACAALLSGCSAERFLADNDFILANVKMESNNRHLPLSNYCYIPPLGILENCEQLLFVIVININIY